MPHIRRSNRIQSKNSKQKSDNSKNEPSINSTVVEVETESETEQETHLTQNQSPRNSPKAEERETGICLGCNQKKPPIKRYEKIEWIQCDVCCNWWHIECASIDKKSAKLIEKHQIQYPCALCVINNAPWIKIVPVNNNTGKINQDNQILIGSDKIAIEENFGCEGEQKRESQTKHIQALSQNQLASDKQCIIVDKIDTKSFRSPKQIQKAIKDKGIEGVEYSYSLVKGGVALQFASKEKARETLSEWPTSVFGKEESIHPLRGESGKTVGFLKNIDPRLSEEEVKLVLKQSGCDIIGVKRCYHRISSRRMPVVKIFHQYNKDLIKSTNADISHTFKGRKAFIEPQRSNRVIRCYQCMRFGHIASCCWFDPKCENCGQSSHCREECKNDTKCANCQGNHSASSSKCPMYLEKLKTLTKQNIM